MKKGLLLLLLTAAIALFFSSCPTPLEQQDLTLLQDLNGPAINITSPFNGGEFLSTLTVTGSIQDCDEAGEFRSGTAGDYLENCSYQIETENGISGTFEVETDGSFSFTITEMNQYNNQVSLLISADDRNGNSSEESLILVPNSTGPSLDITSPGDYDEYASLLILQGHVYDSKSETDEGIESYIFDEVYPEIEYTIPGTSISGTVTLDEINGETDELADGSFYKEINVSSIDGDRTLVITARDLNGNESYEVVNLVKPETGGDISGFSVTAANKQVTISWNAIYGASSYSLYESNYATTIDSLAIELNSEMRLDDQGNLISYSYCWNGLNNGEEYCFQLTAHFEDSEVEDASSSEITSIPLSQRTLCPWIKEEGCGSITIEWTRLPQINKYLVERATSPTGPWAAVRNTSASEYTDRDVEPNTEYYYRVTPDGYSDVVSHWVEGTPGALSMRVVGQVSASDINVLETVVKDGYAYMALGYEGIGIADISDPEHPGEMTFFSINDLYINSISVNGDFLYAANSGNNETEGGLFILDISDKTNPEIRSQTGFGSSNYSGREVIISGNTAYIAASTAGLVIIDITDPDSPGTPSLIKVHKYIGATSAATAYNVIIEGDYAYVGMKSNGISVIDLQTSTELKVIEMDDNIYNFAIKEEYLFAATGSAGVARLSISDPASPGTPEYMDTQGNAKGLWIEENILYIADANKGLALINLDVGDSGEPGEPFYAEGTGLYVDILVSGDYAFISDQHDGLEIIKLTRPYLGGDVETINTGGYLQQVTLSEGTAYLTDIGGNLIIQELSGPDYTYATKYETPINAKEIVVSGEYAFISVNDSGVCIIKLNETGLPEETMNLATGELARSVIVRGDSLFVSTNYGLGIFDISIPENPIEIAEVSLNSYTFSTIVSGDYAYSVYTDGLAITDISDPNNPGEPEYISVTGVPSSLCLYQDYIYLFSRVSSTECYLSAVDVSDPENPEDPVEYLCDFYGDDNMELTTVYDMQCSGDYLFIGGSNNGVFLFNIFRSENPIYFGNILTGDSARGMDIAGTDVNVANGTAGLAKINLAGE